ncbi:cell wall hydrolase [Pyruvatibacter mobilis]|uniref:cell wall hydrolase n=1 Tax=Pyruvatibacter mobilis TaxID=1712261 RepID=UPI003BA8E107
MLNRLDTVLTQIRHRCRSLTEGREWTRKTAIIAAAGAIVLAGSTALTFLGGETDPSQQQAALSISETPDVKAVTAKARARVAGGRLSAPVITLPAVTRSMSDDTFYAVVENAIDIAGEDRLAKRFSKLSEEQIARERQCLAEAIYFEARSEGAKGKLAVAEVVLTRVADKRYPRTICGVVYQGAHLATGCQFSWTCDGLSDIPREKAAWDRSRALAAYVMLDVKWEEVTGKATHYHADYVAPYWAPTLEETATVGKHVFYRWGNRKPAKPAPLQDS